LSAVPFVNACLPPAGERGGASIRRRHSGKLFVFNFFGTYVFLHLFHLVFILCSHLPFSLFQSLYAAHKKQYDQNQDNESETAAWKVTPVFAVGPSGQCARENQNQDNK
jgi:hypothetical protein